MAGNSRRGFALMDPERQREIARKGGKAAHEKGTAHQFTPDEAREAGRKGGMVVSQQREHMVEIGRNGGRARRRRRSDDSNGNGNTGHESASGAQQTSSGQPGSDQDMPEDNPERMSYGAAHGQSARSEGESAPSSSREFETEDAEV